MRCPQDLGETGWQNRPRPDRCRAAVLPTLTSVRTVFPLLVLFILLYFVGTLGAEPLHLFWRSGHDSHTGPVVPIVTVVTANHRTSIVRLVTPWADPDLIAPLVTDHISADRLRYHTPHRGFGTPCSTEGRGRGWHQSWAHCSLGKKWWRQGSRAHTHRNRNWSWRWRFRSVQRRGRLSLRSWHHLADDNLVLASANSQSQPGDNWTWGWDGGLHFYLWKLVH